MNQNNQLFLYKRKSSMIICLILFLLCAVFSFIGNSHFDRKIISDSIQAPGYHYTILIVISLVIIILLIFHELRNSTISAYSLLKKYLLYFILTAAGFFIISIFKLDIPRELSFDIIPWIILMSLFVVAIGMVQLAIPIEIIKRNIENRKLVLLLGTLIGLVFILTQLPISRITFIEIAFAILISWAYVEVGSFIIVIYLGISLYGNAGYASIIAIVLGIVYAIIVFAKKCYSNKSLSVKSN